MSIILDEMRKSSEVSYGDFTAKLIPTLKREKILGVRAPIAKKIAKKYAGGTAGENFLSSLPHVYHDEYILHAYMLGHLSLPFEEMKSRIEGLWPYVDNWACCDVFAPVAISKNKERALVDIYSFIEITIFSFYYTCKMHIRIWCITIF